MATEDVRVTNWPTSNAGSHQAVALDLWKAIRYTHDSPANIDAELDLFRKCLAATYGQK